jgi:uncharacterized protein YajQ (UPF0234 family)
MASFDAVSKVDLMELDNALNTAQKEITQRYDFRGTNTTLERTPEGIIIRTTDEQHLNATVTVLRERMAKRGVSQRCLDVEALEPAAGQKIRQLIKIKQGIDVETGKKMVRALKDSKIRVQAQIQDEQVRVSSKNKDELQAAIGFLRREDFGVDLQFTNFRD